MDEDFKCACGSTLFRQVQELREDGTLHVVPLLVKCEKCETLYKSAFDRGTNEDKWIVTFEGDENNDTTD